MLESNVSRGDTCKEIGVTRHGSDDAEKARPYNGDGLPVNRNFERRRGKSFVDDLTGTGYCKCESRLVLRSTEVQPLFYDLFHPPCYHFSAGVTTKERDCPEPLKRL